MTSELGGNYLPLDDESDQPEPQTRLQKFRLNPELHYDYMAERMLELSDKDSSIGVSALRLQLEFGLPLAPDLSLHRMAAAYNFRDFIKVIKPDYIFAPHHERLIVELFVAGQAPRSRFYVGMPPRHGKSELASVLLPAWYIGRFPERRILHVGNAQMLVESFSRRVREIVRSDTYRTIFPALEVDPRRNRINDWRTTSGGGYLCCGVEASISGHGADLIIIDDPHKDDDWRSMASLDRIYDWFYHAAYTRLEPGGSVVMVATRWHIQDLPGRLLADGTDNWRCLVLPALAGVGDELGRQPGEALWPGRFPASELEKIRKQQGRQWQTLYQNEPQAGTDVLFDISKIERVAEDPDDIEMAEALEERKVEYGYFYTADLALTAKTTADYSVVCFWHWNGAELRLLDSWRVRQSFSDVKDRIVEMMSGNEYKLFLPSDLIEKALHEVLKKEVESGYRRVKQISMEGDKLYKAQLPALMVEQGQVMVQARGAYLDFLKEISQFPQGRYDDFVDNFSLAAEAVRTEFYNPISLIS